MEKRRTDSLWGKIMSLISARRHYFADARPEILQYNLRTLLHASVSGLFLLLFFILISPYIVKDWRPTSEYWAMLPTIFAFLFFSLCYRRVEKKNYYVVQTACVLFYAALFLHFIFISVFPYPASPESYITILLLIMPVLFTVRPSIVFSLSVVMGAVFIVLVNYFKTGVSVSHDVFNTVAGTIFGQFISFFVCNLRISEYNARMQMYEWSRIDPLTGLLNKAACESAINTYLQYRWKGEDYAVMMLDVDNFKRVNDSLGHPDGDRLLRATGEALREAFRKTDVVARVGGDEFFLLMKGVTGNKAVLDKAREINGAISEKVHKKTLIEVSYSVGVAFGHNDEKFDSCFRRADQALYNVKRSGKHGYAVWKEDRNQ